MLPGPRQFPPRGPVPLVLARFTGKDPRGQRCTIGRAHFAPPNISSSGIQALNRQTIRKTSA
jgi:hypothetical protein